MRFEKWCKSVQTGDWMWGWERGSNDDHQNMSHGQSQLRSKHNNMCVMISYLWSLLWLQIPWIENHKPGIVSFLFLHVLKISLTPPATKNPVIRSNRTKKEIPLRPAKIIKIVEQRCLLMVVGLFNCIVWGYFSPPLELFHSWAFVKMNLFILFLFWEEEMKM